MSVGNYIEFVAICETCAASIEGELLVTTPLSDFHVTMAPYCHCGDEPEQMVIVACEVTGRIEC